MDAPSSNNNRRLVALLAFAVALLAITFFVGDTGVYNDDYLYNMRDPATGTVGSLVLSRPWHVWRPVAKAIMAPIVTVLWNHPWVLHAISAVLHGLVTLLFYGLLRRLRVEARIAGPVALAFMVYPAHFEAVLWISTITTLLSAAIVLGIWHTYAWWLGSSERVSGLTRFGILAAIAAGTWCAAAMNEQPVGALAALPLAVLVLGCVRSESRVRTLFRTLNPAIAAGLGIGVYLVGLFLHGRARMAANPHPPLHPRPGFAERVSDLASKVPGEIALRGFGRGALAEGVAAMQAHPITTVCVGGLLVATGLLWIRPRAQDTQADDKIDNGGVGWRLVLLGIAWFFAAWAPIAAVHSFTSPRLHYVPSMGLAITIAGLACVVRTRLPDAWRRTSGIAATLAMKSLVAGLIACAIVMWIGVQVDLLRRFEADQTEIQPLESTFGASLEPGSFLVPVRIDSKVARTGSQRFDNHFQTCWYWELSAGWRAQASMHNPGVYTFLTGEGVAGDGGLWLSAEDPLHFALLRDRSAPPKPRNLSTLLPAAPTQRGRLLSWDRAVFFSIEGPGKTSAYTKLRLHIPGADPVILVPRQVAISSRASELPERVLDVYPEPPDLAPKSRAAVSTSPDTAGAPHPR